MKKLIIAMSAAAVMTGVVSCSKSSNNYDASEKALGDSLAMTFGNMMGQRFGEQLQQMQASNNPDFDKIDKSQIMRGIETVLNADTSNLSYLTGIQIGMQMMNTVIGGTQSGVPVDGAKMAAAFKAGLDTDSLNVAAAQAEYQRVQMSVQSLGDRKAAAAAAVQIEANGKAGAAYIDSIKAADSSVATTESGLSYKIENAGEGNKVTKADKVKLNYKGMTIDGNVFDETKGNPLEMTAGNFIPGFTEGLEMLGKGGKATLYIPGELAYGEKGVPQINIGPNSTLVFEVEVVDIIPAK